MHNVYVLLILSPVTNLIITSSFVVGFTPQYCFRYQGIKVILVLNHKNWFSKRRKHKWPFFSIFTPNFTVSCMQTNHADYKEIFPRISLFQKFKEIITNVVFLEILFWKFLPTQKNMSIQVFAGFALFSFCV